MEFEHYTVALLLANPDAPTLSEKEASALQDAHMSHLADLHETGRLLAVGPVTDPGRELRGLSILNVDSEQAFVLRDADPAVRAGLYRVRLVSWAVPAGLMRFERGFVPRSIADVAGTNSTQS